MPRETAAERRWVPSMVVALSVQLVACAHGSPGEPVQLHVSPGEGTVRITDSTSGGETICSADCTATYPHGTRVDLELSWPGDTRTEGEAIGLTRDVAVRAEWDDRSGHRVAGGFLLIGGLGAGATMWGTGIAYLREGWAWLGIFGSIVGAVSLIFGPYLLGLADRPVLVRSRLPASRESSRRRLPLPWLEPIADGAIIGLTGRL